MTDETNPEDGLDDSRKDILSSVGTEGDETNTGRRSVLRGGAATALATVGFTSTAAAVDPTGRLELDLVQRRYRSAEAKRGAVQQHGRELLGLLAERGYLDAVDVDELVTSELRVVGRRVDGTATAQIRTTETLDGDEVVVAVEPEADRSYAVIYGDAGTTILDPDADGDDVSTEGCLIGTACFAGSSCDSDCEYLEVYCCEDGSCYTGSYEGCCEGTCYSNCSYACDY
jgi:hypothetical protein